jgi:hypothetical protein
MIARGAGSSRGRFSLGLVYEPDTVVYHIGSGCGFVFGILPRILARGLFDQISTSSDSANIRPAMFMIVSSPRFCAFAMFCLVTLARTPACASVMYILGFWHIKDTDVNNSTLRFILRQLIRPLNYLGLLVSCIADSVRSDRFIALSGKVLVWRVILISVVLSFPC